MKVRLLEAMTEAEFIELIDCRFPYSDAAASRRLIAQACAISPNAAFAVADELARPAMGTDVSIATRLESLDILRNSLAHPLACAVLGLAQRKINEKEVTVGEAIAITEQVSAYPGEYAALGLAYMSCDDRDGLADHFYKDIIVRWQGV